MPNFTKIGLAVWISIRNEYRYFALNILDDINLGAGELGNNDFKQG
jgi:hypothetical protein